MGGKKSIAQSASAINAAIVKIMPVFIENKHRSGRPARYYKYRKRGRM